MYTNTYCTYVHTFTCAHKHARWHAHTHTANQECTHTTKECVHTIVKGKKVNFEATIGPVQQWGNSGEGRRQLGNQQTLNSHFCWHWWRNVARNSGIYLPVMHGPKAINLWWNGPLMVQGHWAKVSHYQPMNHTRHTLETSSPYHNRDHPQSPPVTH